jgi:hypothetical protein
MFEELSLHILDIAMNSLSANAMQLSHVDIRLNYRSDEQEVQFSSRELTPKGKVRV